jgi:hypothetical protein
VKVRGDQLADATAVTPGAVDWSILRALEGTGFEAAVRSAVTKVWSQHRSLTERDDVSQEAQLLLASNADIVRGHMENGRPDFLHRWLWSRLQDRYRTEVSRAALTVPLLTMTETGEER